MGGEGDDPRRGDAVRRRRHERARRRQTAFLYALDAATGRQLWWRALKRDLGQTPTITLAHAGGSVFASLDGGLLVAVDASTGAIRWNTRIDLDGRGSRRPRGADVPVTAGTTVYLCCADGALRAFDMRDGRPRWEFAMDEEPSSMKSVPARPRPIVADDLVYVTSLGTASTGSKGAMHVLGDGDGKPRWRRPADKSHGGPLLKRDVVCLSDGASVTAYDAAGGDVRLRLDRRALDQAGSRTEMVTDGARLFVLARTQVLALSLGS
ncbi:PQQ-like beta-propeller repeat protein [Actinomadura madurae]|nr:PQQ-binding-like beta-propeller repeat protein [Actinomadura madurae]MCP9953567.1 PQQ-like beta-propeller repeat protein [Actinomadura madurae]